MKLIYIAGPFRPKILGNMWEMELNIRIAEALALEVWRAGYVAICPHLNTRSFQGALDDSVWLKGDLAILERCDALITALWWKNSKGATAEVKHAIRLSIPVYHSIVELRRELSE